MQASAAGEVINAATALGGVVAKEAGKELQVFFYRQGGVEVFAQALRPVGNARADCIAVALFSHVAAQHFYPALLQGTRTRYEREQAGFAHAIGANHANHAASGQIERDASQRGDFAIVQLHILQAHYGKSG